MSTPQARSNGALATATHGPAEEVELETPTVAKGKTRETVETWYQDDGRGPAAPSAPEMQPQGGVVPTQPIALYGMPVPFMDIPEDLKRELMALVREGNVRWTTTRESERTAEVLDSDIFLHHNLPAVLKSIV